MNVRSLVLLAAVGLGSCDCGDARLRKSGGELAVEELQLDFGAACPAPPDAGLDVEPARRSLRVRNRGNALLYLNGFEVEPAKADLFVVDEARVPETLEAGEEVEVPIAFLPREVGLTVADLTLVGDDEEAEPIVVKLVGEGMALPLEPSLALSCPGGKWENDACDSAGPNYFFDDTPVGSTGEGTILLANEGCAALSVTGLRVTDATTGSEGSPAFSLAAANTLRIAGGQRVGLQVRFSPPAPGAFVGALDLQTNCPAGGATRVALRGLGVAAVLGLDPGFCDLRALVPECDGRFSLANHGGEELVVESVGLLSGDPMFRLLRSPAAGTRIPPHGRLEVAVEIEYLPGPRLGSDLLVVESTAGRVTAELRGGAPPVLRTEPEALLDFGVELAEGRDYFLPVRLENPATWARQATLTLRSVELDGRPPSNAGGAFALAGSGEAGCPEPPPAGTAIAPGAHRLACVRFRAPSGGGSFFANLIVRSDDPDFPDPAGRLLSLTASTSCDPAPVAQVSVPGTSPCPCESGSECVGGLCHLVGMATVGLASRTVALSGASSYDLVADGTGACAVRDPGAIRLWEWSLVGSPEGSLPTLVPEGRGEESQATLAFDVAGRYLVGLVVHDASGRPSARTIFSVQVDP